MIISRTKAGYARNPMPAQPQAGVVNASFRRGREFGSKKSGQSGSDVPAPRKALYSCMRERGNGTNGPESLEAFRTKCASHMFPPHFML